MAYDEELSNRFRDVLGGMVGISEKRMMGALCFMHYGNMIGAAGRYKSGEGWFMFRVGKQNEAEALTKTGARVMEQGGKRMSGFIFVGEDDVDDEALRDWVSLAMSFVFTLPEKAPKSS